MMTWAIRKVMDKYPEDTFSLRELEKMLEDVWDDLVDAGEIETIKDNEP